MTDRFDRNHHSCGGGQASGLSSIDDRYFLWDSSAVLFTFAALSDLWLSWRICIVNSSEFLIMPA
jgi:hypothetical protein